MADNGTVVSTMDYWPYGTMLSQTGSGDTRFKYTGHERDDESALDYMLARMYENETGRFMQMDPLADKYPGISPYVYTAGNPLKYVDPDGRAFFLPAIPLAVKGVTLAYAGLTVAVAGLVASDAGQAAIGAVSDAVSDGLVVPVRNLLISTAIDNALGFISFAKKNIRNHDGEIENPELTGEQPHTEEQRQNLNEQKKKEKERKKKIAWELGRTPEEQEELLEKQQDATPNFIESTKKTNQRADHYRHQTYQQGNEQSNQDQ